MELVRDTWQLVAVSDSSGLWLAITPKLGYTRERYTPLMIESFDETPAIQHVFGAHLGQYTQT
ncbi:MAG: hypothetical protein CM15mV7_0390 [uncultured marine virus]|nr:MAG: hypothetical protein CM15mV7_0390 [uncultured marine virus]